MASSQWNVDSLSQLIEKFSQSGIADASISSFPVPQRQDHQADRYPQQQQIQQGSSYLQPQQQHSVAQNLNRRNGSGPDNRDSVLRKTSLYIKPRVMLDGSKSLNPFINGSRSYSMREDGPMCVAGGCYNARKDDGHQCNPVPAWEQSYLREVVFGVAPQVSFVSAGCGEFD